MTEPQITIAITREMVEAAKAEAAKRHPDIHHHFQVAHFTPEQRDIVGFIGEFSACEMLGLEWQSNIRPDYKTIDDQDIIIAGKKIDVKTESVPSKYVDIIASRQIKDDAVFGRRLINAGQASLLAKYDIVLFGLIDREKINCWYPIGWINTNDIIGTYFSTTRRPDGGLYPFACLPIKTSELKDAALLGKMAA